MSPTTRKQPTRRPRAKAAAKKKPTTTRRKATPPAKTKRKRLTLTAPQPPAKKDRHDDDFYRTPAWVTSALLRKWAPRLRDVPARIMEPCAGDGAIVDQVRECWPEATIDAFDLSPRRADIQQIAMHGHSTGGDYDLVITNWGMVRRMNQRAAADVNEAIFLGELKAAAAAGGQHSHAIDAVIDYDTWAACPACQFIARGARCASCETEAEPCAICWRELGAGG